MPTNPNRGHRIKILKVFRTKLTAGKKERTPFTWCLEFQGAPIALFYGWSIIDGQISSPQYRSRKGSYNPISLLSERILYRLYDLLRALLSDMVNPYRPKALAWCLDANFRDRASAPLLLETLETASDDAPSEDSEEPNAAD